MSAWFTAAIETALNRYLDLDPEAKQRQLARLQDRIIAIELQGLAVRLYFLPDADGIQVMQHYEGEPDVLISGSPLSLARMTVGGKPGSGLFAGAVSFGGDTALGQEFQELLKAIDVDWEELLAGLIGDPLAHQAGRAVRHGQAYAQRVRHTLEQDLSEYLREEARLLPTASEVDRFFSDVDRIRDDVERLEARLRRLEKRLAAQP